MKKIGSYIAIFGLFAIVMGFLNKVPRLLSWIYNWGVTTAWIIKIAMVLVGAALYFMDSSSEEEPETITKSSTEE